MISKKEQYMHGRLRMYVRKSRRIRWTGERLSGRGRRRSGRYLSCC